MRDTFEWIDGATEANENLRHALYDMAAHQIATQALPVAFATLGELSNESARTLIETVAGYPGVTSRRITTGQRTTIGDRATEILLRLARMRPGFTS